MDTEELFPRLALAGALVAVVVVYSRRRRGRLKAVKNEAAALPGAVAASASEAAGTISERSQSLLEGVLDNIAEQAMKELKNVLKDGLKRLEKTIDTL